MLELARPAFLWAGLALALLPPLLHLVVRRPKERAALPTARFLSPDARASVRLQRRPTDLLLLLLRSLFLLVLGAALAGPVWREEADGSLDLVLLDRGVGEGWAEAVDSARSLLLRDGSAPVGTLLLFDTAAVRVPAADLSAAFFDSLSAAPPAARGDYAVALRSAREAARAQPGADSVRLTLITRPAWQGWSPGLAALREAGWPGRIRLVAVGGSDTASERGAPAEPAFERVAAVLASEEGRPYLEAALAALGWTAVGAGETAALHVAAAPLTNAQEAELLANARAGAVVVVAGEVPEGPLGEALAWRPGSPPAAGDAPGALVLRDGTALPGAARRSLGTPAPGAATLAAWEDGRPAAAAAREGSGCLVYLGASLTGGELPLASGFPRLLEVLAGGCEAGPGEGGGRRGPLDRGAVALLEGTALPPAVSAAALRGEGGGRPLARWLLLGALGLALGEAGLAYGRRR